jgi:hypothetical protein
MSWEGTKIRLSNDWHYARLLWYGLGVVNKRQSPKKIALDLIKWWQTWVTSDDGLMPNRCPRGAGKHCSLLGQQAVARYGILIGGILVLNYMRLCRRDFGPKGCG